jgi:glyoxylase-like metal-dependent hydrolase (beta-lactamase superfamily II)
MKPIEEYSTICHSPPFFFWGGYDAAVKYECSCSAIVTSAGLVFVDPLPLAPEALAALLAEAKEMAVGILLTSGNHQRWSVELAEQLTLPIYAPVGAGEEIIASHFYEPGDELLGLRSIALSGFGPGETALWHEEGKTLILGDALTNGGEEGLLVLPKKYCTDHRLAMKSLKNLKNFTPAIFVTAHGLPIVGNATAKLASACALRE